MVRPGLGFGERWWLVSEPLFLSIERFPICSHQGQLICKRCSSLGYNKWTFSVPDRWFCLFRFKALAEYYASLTSLSIFGLVIVIRALVCPSTPLRNPRPVSLLLSYVHTFLGMEPNKACWLHELCPKVCHASGVVFWFKQVTGNSLY